MYNRPFNRRSPNFKRVKYEFTYSGESEALAAFESIKNKRYTIAPGGVYVLPVGHRINARDEKLDGNRVSFVGQLKSEDLESPATQALELEIAGTAGSLTGKTILA